jgi:hypothetical protein
MEDLIKTYQTKEMILQEKLNENLKKAKSASQNGNKEMAEELFDERNIINVKIELIAEFIQKLELLNA